MRYETFVNYARDCVLVHCGFDRVPRTACRSDSEVIAAPRKNRGRRGEVCGKRGDSSAGPVVTEAEALAASDAIQSSTAESVWSVTRDS